MSVDRKATRCPLCKAPQTQEFAPFCSRGCRDRDLLKWMGGDYRIAGRSTEEDELQKSSDYGAGDFEEGR
ncbi:MAG: DNA gyrase inhibitor YacG [Sphingobium sp.]